MRTVVYIRFGYLATIISNCLRFCDTSGMIRTRVAVLMPSRFSFGVRL